MEEPYFIKCEPHWGSDTEDSPNLVRETDHEINTALIPPKTEDDPSSFAEVVIKEAEWEDTDSNECIGSRVGVSDDLGKVAIPDFGVGSTGTKNNKKRKYYEPCACNICGKVLKNSNSLHYHKFVHSTERNFACDTCGRKFKAGGALRNHMLCHSNVAPFKCDVCSRAFKRVEHLKRHNIRHSKSTPYQCGICGRAFKTMLYLENHHQKIHSSMRNKDDKPKYVCNICDAGFQHASQLKYHSAGHNGDSLLSCDKCGSKFAQRSALNHHKCLIE